MGHLDDKNRSERVALVTGATSGIGITIAQRLVSDGFKVMITGRSRDRGAQVVSTLGENSRFFPVDLTNEGAAELIVAETINEFGRLDVVVNNAAEDHTNELLAVTEQEIVKVFQTNTFAAMNLLISAGSRMKAQGGGAVINITSRLASIGVPTLAVYSASKGAIHAFTKAAAIELAPDNIRVNSVAPGPTRTPLYEEWIGSLSDPESEEASITASIPLGRIAEPHDVAAAVSYLASPGASYVTGISIPVEGGYLAQ